MTREFGDMADFLQKFQGVEPQKPIDRIMNSKALISVRSWRDAQEVMPMPHTTDFLTELQRRIIDWVANHEQLAESRRGVPEDLPVKMVVDKIGRIVQELERSARPSVRDLAMLHESEPIIVKWIVGVMYPQNRQLAEDNQDKILEELRFVANVV